MSFINRCSNCKNKAKFKCKKCKSSNYCSKDCQITNWPIHKKICLQIQTLEDNKKDDVIEKLGGISEELEKVEKLANKLNPLLLIESITLQNLPTIIRLVNYFIELERITVSDIFNINNLLTKGYIDKSTIVIKANENVLVPFQSILRKYDSLNKTVVEIIINEDEKLKADTNENTPELTYKDVVDEINAIFTKINDYLNELKTIIEPVEKNNKVEEIEKTKLSILENIGKTIAKLIFARSFHTNNSQIFVSIESNDTVAASINRNMLKISVMLDKLLKYFKSNEIEVSQITLGTFLLDKMMDIKNDFDKLKDDRIDEIKTGIVFLEEEKRLPIIEKIYQYIDEAKIDIENNIKILQNFVQKSNIIPF